MHAQQNQKSSLRTYITLLEIVKKNLNHTVTQSMRHVVALLLHKNSSVFTKPSPSSCSPSYFVDIKWVKHFTRDQGLIFHRTWVQTSFLRTSRPFLCLFAATSFPYNQIRQAISTTEKKITWNLVETLDTHIKQEFLKWNHFHRLKMSKQNKSQCHNNK